MATSAPERRLRVSAVTGAQVQVVVEKIRRLDHLLPTVPLEELGFDSGQYSGLYSGPFAKATQIKPGQKPPRHVLQEQSIIAHAIDAAGIALADTPNAEEARAGNETSQTVVVEFGSGTARHRATHPVVMGKGGDASAATQGTRGPIRLVGDKSEKYTWAEVKKHITPDDAWVVYKNRVYDVSDWHEHPGGGVIFTHAGDDMTDIFAAFHAQGSQSLMKKFYIGDLIPESVEHKDQRQRDFEKGYRDLRAKLVMMGMFNSSKGYYAYKCSFNMSMWLTAVAMVYFSDNLAVHIASALLLGLFWQQCGWLAHDFLHHQVFKQRKYGDLAGIFWGDLMQGFSMQWWKNKHNGHHAVPNLHNSSLESQDGDPDIDTMPLLAWSLKQAQSFREKNADGKDSKFVKYAIKFQALTYFPILLLARISWLNESFKTAYGLGASTENAKLEMERRGLQYPLLEKIGIALHYCWMFALSTGFGQWSVAYSFMYFFTATCSSGLFLALVFGLGHNGMAVYDATTRPDFWKLQVTTTRNIVGGHGIPQFFVDWFCGGLQYQVDHHLFPMMPRNNIAKCHKLVESFCKEWGVQYHEADMFVGTVEVLSHLQNVSDEFLVDMVKEFPAM